MRINDQSAAVKLAICDDIGERSYDGSEVASILVQILARLPTVGMSVLIYTYHHYLEDRKKGQKYAIEHYIVLTRRGIPD